MSLKLYVGNLPYRTTTDDLRKLFKKYGPIHSLVPIIDKETDQPRGYCFVELDEIKAVNALYDLRNTVFKGRTLKISVATGRDSIKEREEAPGKKASEKKLMGKRNVNKPAAACAAPPRRHQTTTEYMVADKNNYG
ncbi:MAG: RNA-binding protein [Chitinispirillales bacterium]|jgi:RNA recognition motif-containing protein|nr:RNA-binding protein [Chitinispirillales bacterium]